MYELVQLASLFSSGPNKDSINRFLVVQGSSIFKIFKKYPHSWLLYIADPHQLIHKKGRLNIFCVLPIVSQSF